MMVVGGRLLLCIIILIRCVHVYAACSDYDGYEFCDDFEGRATGTSELGVINTTPWEYNWESHPGGWANCPGTDGCVQITNTTAKTGTQCMELMLNEDVENINNQFARAFNGDDTSLAGWSAWTRQDELYIEFYIMFETGSSMAPAPGRHHLCLIMAGAYTSPTTTDMTIYLDKGVETFTIQGHSANQGGTAELYLDNIAWDGGYGDWTPDTTPPNISNNQWYSIQFWVKMNTFTADVANKDGEFKLWIDGVEYYHYENNVFRTSNNMTAKWNKVLISSNTPPDEDGHPDSDQSVYIDDFVISQTYITTSTKNASIGSGATCKLGSGATVQIQ